MKNIAGIIIVPQTAQARTTLMARWRNAPSPPASAVWNEADGGWDPDWSPLCDTWDPVTNTGGVPCALPIWWDGTLVPEGWDRLRRVLRLSGWPDDPTPHGGLHYLRRMLQVNESGLYAAGFDAVCVDVDGAPC